MLFFKKQENNMIVVTSKGKEQACELRGAAGGGRLVDASSVLVLNLCGDNAGVCLIIICSTLHVYLTYVCIIFHTPQKMLCKRSSTNIWW